MSRQLLIAAISGYYYLIIMLTVFKYDISHTVEIPKSASLLKVDYQEGCLYAWYCVDTDEKDFRRDKYTSFGTGWDITTEGDVDYIDTLFDEDGYVWHIYKVLS